MKNLFEAIKAVVSAVFAPRGDSTPITLTPDFPEMNFKNLGLSSEAMQELLAGRKDADAFEQKFGQVSAQKSQPFVQSRAKARTAQSQIPSQDSRVKITRTSIVRGETIRREPDDDKEPEITFGPKY